MATLISSLTPAALSVGVIPVEGELTAFRVGSVASDSVIQAYLSGVETNPRFSLRASEAASMAWVQGVLGINLPFQAISPKYGVPIPLDLRITDRARYITDVAIMDPFCAWTTPNPPVIPVGNSSEFDRVVNITLPDFGVTTLLSPNQFAFSDSGRMVSLEVIDTSYPSLSLVNISTGGPTTTGVMGWFMAACKSCEPVSWGDNITVNMSGIPTQEYHGLRVVGNATQAQTIEFSILMCDPRLSVDTREVRLDGTGKITVMESKGLTRQGNLHLAQTRLLVGKALTEFSSNSGPKTMYSGIGQAAQIQMFFGPVENSTLTPVLTPRPIEELTHGYMVAQQAAMRSYLSGRMASSFVPGRKQKMILAFTSSLPQVIVSTILFIFATIFINLCHLRSDAEQFTLFSVAAALSHSNLSRICEAAKYGDGSQETLAQDVAMKSLENRRICLINNDGPAWATLPIHAPPRIEDSGPFLHGADVALGTPPQNTTFILDTTSPVQHALTPDCVFCPTEGMYDMSASSSLVKDPSLGAFGDTLFGGSRGYESITLGGLLQDSRAMVSFVDQMSPDRYIGLRFAGGKYLTKKRVQSIIHNLNEQGQLLNPVWGLRLGGENPQLTIGALDPKDYEGEINWVPVLNDSYMIQIDALKGYNGNAFPLPSPLNVLINSVSRDIYVPDLTLYYMNESLVGPQEFINIYPRDNSRFGILCNGTKPPSVEFSVEINGIDYPVNPTDMIRPPSGFSASGFCNVGVVKSSLPDFTLGITFLRSVYLAYRFPTGSCPGYFGFAAPKGGPTPTSTRKPRTTPTDAATCLSFVTPSSTPTPTIAVSQELERSGASEETYPVYGRPDDEWVKLRGVKELPVLKVSGGIYGFGG
ncbi:unnamed protein product [Rhizoctonia solani]|uniref:Peptidase A1 domain-containing protein n=1 Tax=Rhizoctonia solani TaxID=456999 RepID=A0A8H2XCS4_9AGAM|nr:unnamed protein product [Rhizoctonia solani]